MYYNTYISVKNKTLQKNTLRYFQ